MIALGILFIILGILTMGALLSILGILAIASPLIATQALTIALSWSFLLGGSLRVLYAIQTRREKGFWPKLFLGLLLMVVGILLLSHIIGSILSLTLGLGMAIFIEGVFEVILASQLRPKASWGWVLLSGIITIIAGILLLAQWPSDSPGILGLLPGSSFIMTGIWTVMFSLATHRSANEA
jgi:uncharacterized membrane protein HdeD (DUF308 family)